MDVVITPTSTLRGSLVLPTDKAICHRVALACALAEGETEISPWSTAVDCEHTLALLERLGVAVHRSPERVRIHGVGLMGLQAPTRELPCGESGTTMRLACGLLAGQPFTSRLDAEPSLRKRPMQRIAAPLSRMGARIEGASGPAASTEMFPPLTITGQRPLSALRYVMPVASAQVKSAILFAGLYAEGPVDVVELSQTRDHTERLLVQLGVCVTRTGDTLRLLPPHAPLRAPGSLTIPGDISSAAFFLVAGAIVPGASLEIRHVGLNPTRTHLIRVLQRMGASITSTVERDDWEPSGTLRVEARRLRGITIPAGEAPFLIDELPILMVAACAAQGPTSFEGLGELRVKETDRLQSMTAGLSAMGAAIRRRGEADVVIEPSALHGARVESVGDHRTAMSLAVAGLIAQGQTMVQGAECVAKSFGDFFERLGSVAGASSVRLQQH